MGRIISFWAIICCYLIGLSGCKPTPQTYVVSIGVSDYKNIQDLRLPEKDAAAMVQLFENRKANVSSLLGTHATKANIIKALKEQFAHAQSQDLVVFFFSGHGYPGGFCPYDMSQQMKSGLSYDEIKDIFKECKAQNKVVFADACFAGQFRRESELKESTAVTQKIKEITDGTNVLLFLSSRSNETSIESPFMANGMFTAALLRALRGGADVNLDRLITAKELFDFVSQNVKEKSHDKQHPVMWGKFDDNMIIMNWQE